MKAPEVGAGGRPENKRCPPLFHCFFRVEQLLQSVDPLLESVEPLLESVNMLLPFDFFFLHTAGWLAPVRVLDP